MDADAATGVSSAWAGRLPPTALPLARRVSPSPPLLPTVDACGDCGRSQTDDPTAHDLAAAAATAAAHAASLQPMGSGRRGKAGVGGRRHAAHLPRQPRGIGAGGTGGLPELSLSSLPPTTTTWAPRRRRIRPNAGTADALLPRLPIHEVSKAVARHLNEPTRLRGILRRLSAANAASHAAALAVWASEHEVDEAAYRPLVLGGSPRGRGAPSYYDTAPLPSVPYAATAATAAATLPAAVMPARIVWHDVRLAVDAETREAVAAPVGVAAGAVARMVYTVRSVVVGSRREGACGIKVAEDGEASSWWLFLRAVVLVVFALLWVVGV